MMEGYEIGFLVSEENWYVQVPSQRCYNWQDLFPAGEN